MTDQSRTMSLCCPDRPMMAKGLCSSCYQKGRKNLFQDYTTIIHSYQQRKKELADKRFIERCDKYNKKRREPTYKYTSIKYRYGLSKEDYEKLLEDQNNLCAICKSTQPSYVDHCHKTQVVRGLLCPKCNTLVGYLETSDSILPEAFKYIQKGND